MGLVLQCNNALAQNFYNNDLALKWVKGHKMSPGNPGYASGFSVLPATLKPPLLYTKIDENS